MTELTANPEYNHLCSALSRFPKARIPTLEEFESLHLRGGAGTGKEGDHCSLQVVRLWEGHEDTASYTVPDTDSQVCGRFLIRFQDAVKDDAIRDRLCKPLAVLLIGSAGSLALEQKRMWMSVDWALREAAPLWLDYAGLTEHAAALRALPEVVDRVTAEACRKVRNEARDAAWKLRNEKLAELRATVKSDAVAVADADAVADAVAVAVAAAVAAAVADAAAAAVAVADAVAVAAADAVADADAARGTARWSEIYNQSYQKVRAILDGPVKEKLRATSEKSWESGALCLRRMLEATEASASAS